MSATRLLLYAISDRVVNQHSENRDRIACHDTKSGARTYVDSRQTSITPREGEPSKKCRGGLTQPNTHGYIMYVAVTTFVNLIKVGLADNPNVREGS